MTNQHAAAMPRCALVAFGMAAGVAVAGFMTGYLSTFGISSDSETMSNSKSAPELLVSILARNVPVTILLYSEVATLGLTTLLAGFLLWGYIGATFAAAATNVGLQVAAASIAVYAPLEAAAFLVAAGAGLAPACSAAMVGYGSKSRTYFTAVARSLRPLAISLLITLLAAALETIIILSRK